MKFISTKGIGGSILGLLLLLGIGIVTSTKVQAQYPDPSQDRYRRNRDYDRDEQDRYRRDRDGDRYNRDQYRRDRDYDRYQQDRYRRDGDRDRWDDRSELRRNGYRYYGGSFDLRQTALNAGFSDGVKAGRDDGRHGRRYDFERHSEFQKASRDYSSRLGDRGTYQRYYRDAFEHGYADGYAGY